MKIILGKIEIEFNLNISWDKKYMKEVKNALREGNRLLAIKIYKNATGDGLRDSKEAVDKLLPKYYKDYNPNARLSSATVSTVQHTGCLPNPNAGLKTPMYGVCKSSDVYSSKDKPQIYFAGTYRECFDWKQSHGFTYCMVSLSEEEVRNFKLCPGPDPNPNAGSENSEFGAMSKIKYTHGVYHADEIKPISIGSYIECNKYIIWNVPPLTRDKYSIKPLSEFQLKQYNNTNDPNEHIRDRYK